MPSRYLDDRGTVNPYPTLSTQDRIATEFNSHPRHILGFQTPSQALAAVRC